MAKEGQRLKKIVGRRAEKTPFESRQSIVGADSARDVIDAHHQN